MADNSVILDIKVSNEDAVLAIQKAQDALSLLKQKERELKEQWQENTITEKDYAAAMGATKQGIEEQTMVIKANQDALKQNVKEQKSAEGSLVALRAQLKQLTTAYDNMSKAERDGAKGQEMLEHIKAVTEELKTAEEASGRFQRNVGNYENSFKNAFNSLGDLKDGLEGIGAKGSAKAVDGLNKVNKGFNALKANPVGASISAIVFVVTQLADAFKGDEKAMSSFKSLTKSLQPLLNALKAVFEKIIGVVTKAINAIAKFINKIVSAIPGLKRFNVEEEKVTETTEKVTETTEKATKATNNYAEAVKKAAEVELAERRKVNDMVLKLAGDQKRMLEAQYNVQIEDIKNRLKTEKTLTEGAKKALNAQVVLLEAEQQIAIADIDKKSIEERYKAQLEATKAQIELERNNADERYRLRESAIVQETNMAKRALDDRLMAEQLTNQQYGVLIEQLRQRQADQLLALEEEKNAEILGALKQRMENEINALAEGSIERLNAEVELKRVELDTLHQMELESEEEFIERKISLQKQYDNAVAKSAQQQVAINKAKAEGIASITNILSATMEAAAGENEDLVKASKVVALAEVAIKQGIAIAEAVASASAGDPYTYALRVAAAIASTIAAMATAISSINSASFATGGLVQGPGTGTSDSIRANVSNGEFIVNAAATKKNLATLVAINGGWGNTSKIPNYAQGGVVGVQSLGVSQSMSDTQEMIMDAVANIQPVVSVREITKVQHRITAKERIAKQ